jgi:hypothetical protein
LYGFDNIPPDLCTDTNCYEVLFSSQVKLAYQESELLQLLKKIPLGPQMMEELQSRAEQLQDGSLKSRGDALLPLTLATFLFEALCLPSKSLSYRLRMPGMDFFF